MFDSEEFKNIKEVKKMIQHHILEHGDNFDDFGLNENSHKLLTSGILQSVLVN
jgi:hypothetical protein